MSNYILALDNLFRIEADSEAEAHEEMRRRLREGELYDPHDVVIQTIDIEDDDE